MNKAVWKRGVWGGKVWELYRSKDAGQKLPEGMGGTGHVCMPAATEGGLLTPGTVLTSGPERATALGRGVICLQRESNRKFIGSTL